MNSNLTKRQQAYIDAIITHAPSLGIDTNKTEFSRAELRQVSMQEKGKVWIPNWITHDQSRRAGRGVFNIPEVMESMATTAPSVEEQEDISYGNATPVQEEKEELMSV